MTESKFVSKPGQIDFTHARYCPVINTVVTKEGKIMLVQRSSGMHLYPNYWNGISGFLDDMQSIKDKVYEELREELSIKSQDISDIRIGQLLLQDAPEYQKTWLIVPVLAAIKTEELTLDWEAQKAQWFEPKEIRELNLLPGFVNVVRQFFQL